MTRPLICTPGRTPWSAADALIGFSCLQANGTRADEGVRITVN
jgi:hypothetical protein